MSAAASPQAVTPSADRDTTLRRWIDANHDERIALICRQAANEEDLEEWRRTLVAVEILTPHLRAASYLHKGLAKIEFDLASAGQRMEASSAKLRAALDANRRRAYELHGALKAPGDPMPLPPQLQV